MTDRKQSDRQFTERGFEDFTEFRDVYGSKITVRESSLATESCVWIFATDNPQIKEPSPHLNAEQAKMVADALYAFAMSRLPADPPEGQPESRAALRSDEGGK